MDELATNLLSSLKKPSASIESKLALFTQVKSRVKHERIPDSAEFNILECIYLALTSQTSASLVAAGFSALGHVVKRLTLQDQVSVVFGRSNRIVNALLEKLGDAKESHRTAASQAFSELWHARAAEIERLIREGAIQGINVRAKEAGMQWVTKKMHTEQNMPFKSFVGPIIECLEDAEGSVRESAKNNVIDLFSHAPQAAKADLKRQLITHNVRKSIATHILERLQISGIEGNLAASTRSLPPTAPSQQEHSMVDSTKADALLPPSANADHIEPLEVYTHRELEDIFRDMHLCFEGKETEQNWMSRDSNVLKLRRLLKGNAPTAYHSTFVGGVKAELDGILKVANSLRTTMSSNGCHLVQELARTLGATLDPMVELLLQNFTKMCSNTKHISAQNGNETVDVLFSTVTCNARALQHIWLACQDKNVKPRYFAPEWLKTVLKRHVQNKSHYEHIGGVELTDRSIRKGLADADPKVREGMRGTYWIFAQTWPEQAETIMASLDAKSKQLLEKDPGNPHSSTAVFSRSVGAGATVNSKTIVPKASSTLKETIAAQRKAALAGKHLVERPASAMSTFSPVRQPVTSAPRMTSHLSTTSTSTAARTPSAMSSHLTARAPPALAFTTAQNQGSLMSAPLRRPRRPEGPRPATADLYASRRIMRAETPPRSPGISPVKIVAKPSVSHNMSSHVRVNSASSISRDTANSVSQSAVLNPTSPVRKKPQPGTSSDSDYHMVGSGSSHHDSLSPLSQDDNFTMVFPDNKRLPRSPLFPHIPGVDHHRPASGHSSLPSMAEEENFTLVIPQKTALHDTSISGIARARIPPANSIARRVQLEHTEQVSAIDFASNTQVFTSSSNVRAIEHADKPVMVYEDPETASAAVTSQKECERTVLEELPVNKHINASSSESQAVEDIKPLVKDEEGAVSPRKNVINDFSEVLAINKTQDSEARGVLESSIKCIKARKVDAHGFRDLQDVIKVDSGHFSVQLNELLVALLDYLRIPDEDLRVAMFKAQTLKSQALIAIRAVLLVHRSDNRIRAEYPRALCAVVQAKGRYDGGSHIAVELDKTGDQIIRLAGEQAEACLDQVMSLICDRDVDEAAEDRRVLIMALNVLTKLLGMFGDQLELHQRQRMGKVARRFLGDLDPEVRQADTNFCLELHGTFGASKQEEFWECLAGVAKGQLNLVAYYLAKKGQA